MRPPCGSFAHLSASISNVPSSLPLKSTAGRRQCLAGDFPKRSGVAGQAAEQHPGAADHDGHSVGAADPGLRARSGAPGLALPGIQLLLADTRGCHDRRDGDQLARVACDGPQVASVLGDQEPGRAAGPQCHQPGGSAGHVQAAAAGVAQRQGDAVRAQPDLRVPSSVHARRPGLTSLYNDPCSPVIGDRTTWASRSSPGVHLASCTWLKITSACRTWRTIRGMHESAPRAGRRVCDPSRRV